jgi:hypothetical protein
MDGHAEYNINREFVCKSCQSMKRFDDADNILGRKRQDYSPLTTSFWIGLARNNSKHYSRIVTTTPTKRQTGILHPQIANSRKIHDKFSHIGVNRYSLV